MWKYYALLSAFFAALTAIFAKIGVKDINSDLATAIRTTVILLIIWSIVFMGNLQTGIKSILSHTWIFLILSGCATGLSWLFYFKAIQLGDVSRVAPIDKLSVVITICLAFIFLKEPVNQKTLLGACLITAGSIVILYNISSYLCRNLLQRLLFILYNPPYLVCIHLKIMMRIMRVVYPRLCVADALSILNIAY